MPMDRSRRVGSIKRVNKDGASGRTGNALGPTHMGGAPAGRAQVRGQETSASGQYRATGKRGNPRTLNQRAPIGLLTFRQNIAGQTYDFKALFENYAAGAGTWVSTAVPAGMTLNSTTGILSGTPTTLGTGSPTLTVLAGNADTKPQSIAASWQWSIVV